MRHSGPLTPQNFTSLFLGAAVGGEKGAVEEDGAAGAALGAGADGTVALDAGADGAVALGAGA
eukprot:6549404-Prymnesium_polylepis.1